MSAKAWKRRRQWKRLETAMRYVWKHPESKVLVELDGDPYYLLGQKHPVFHLLEELGCG